MSAPSSPEISVLDTPSPSVSCAEAEIIARDVFGIDARVRLLAGERDLNFHLEADGSQYVLKVANPAEDRQVLDFQSAALLHVASVAPDLPVPRVVQTRDGHSGWLLHDGGEACMVRVLTFMKGEPLSRVPSTIALRRAFGETGARLDIALQTFAHPAPGHELMWDLTHASAVRAKLAHIADPSRRALAERFLDNFERHARPRLPDLRAQVIHNDLNPHNVLVTSDGRHIAGIIDFGDMVHAPLIADLAIAAAYQLSPVDHPLSTITDLVAAYDATLPLLPAEQDILFDLIATRMLLTVTISAWRASRYPDNAAYILRNCEKAWAGLERCDTLSRAEAQDYLRGACRAERPS